MMRIRHAARRVFSLAVLVLAAALTAAGPSPAARAGGGDGPAAKPTVVLVHGAWADDSGWDEVVRSLQAKGYPVVATANPLRGLDGDAAYLAARLKTIEGPVVLAAHSYGGAVITNAAAVSPNVESLVYIAAFAPDEGETALELAAEYPGSRLSDDPDAPFPTALSAVPLSDDPADIDTYIKPDKFGDVFLSDRLPAAQADALAARQRPAHLATTTQATSAVAWKTIPSWYLVATDDRTIGTDNLRFMAERAGATTVEVDAPHAVLETDPEDVTELILRAAHDFGPELAATGAGERAAVLAGAVVPALAGGTALVARSRRS